VANNERLDCREEAMRARYVPTFSGGEMVWGGGGGSSGGPAVEVEVEEEEEAMVVCEGRELLPAIAGPGGGRDGWGRMGGRVKRLGREPLALIAGVPVRKVVIMRGA
jgi:hypothetical protein